MNTTTKLNAKTLMQLLAIAMITLTLFSCGGGSDDTTTPPATTQFVTPTIISANATKVSMLSALATGTPSQVVISWSAAQGEDKYYRLYQSKTDLSGYQNASPTNLSKSSKVIITTHTSNASTITLSDAQTVYFLVTTIRDSDTNDDKFESYTNTTQTAATAFTMPFLTVVATGTGTGSGSGAVAANNRVWMDRNLGASRVAESSTDTLAYGDLYQWGGSYGYQASATTIASTDTIATSITPTHGQFITSSSDGDWTTADVDGALRSAYWGRIDGSSICPTGFRVPTGDELATDRDSWYGIDYIGAYTSNLKWPTAGWRNNNAEFIADKNVTEIEDFKYVAYIWSLTPAIDNGTVSKTDSVYLNFDGGGGTIGLPAASRTLGYSVRCIKD